MMMIMMMMMRTMMMMMMMMMTMYSVVGCGTTVRTNNTYFSSSLGVTSPCQTSVCRSEDNVCQLRLDFEAGMDIKINHFGHFTIWILGLPDS